MALIVAFDEFACKDPRDRVYTLASLAMDTTVVEVTVPEIRQFISQGMRTDDVPRILPVMINYEADIEDVYTAFAYLVAAAGRFDWLLKQACARQARLPSTAVDQRVPSWVPDWRVVTEGHMRFWANEPKFYKPAKLQAETKELSWLESSLKSVNTIISGPSRNIPAYRIRTPLGRIITNQSVNSKMSPANNKTNTAPLYVI